MAVLARTRTYVELDGWCMHGDACSVRVPFCLGMTAAMAFRPALARVLARPGGVHDHTLIWLPTGRAKGSLC